MLDGVKLLENSGSTAIAIPCNTSHYFFEELQENSALPIINMVEETLNTARDQGFRKVALLCTQGTRVGRVYEHFNLSPDLSLIYPDAHYQNLVDQIIYDQIKAGRPLDVDMLTQVMDAMAALCSDAVILGCTELSVACRGLPDFDIPIVDSLEVLAAQVLNRFQDN